MNIEVSGIDYHVEVSGVGFPVVLLHGFTGSISTWSECEEELMKNSKIIKIDLVGHGRSSSPDSIKRYEMKSVLADLRYILQYLNIDQADVVGYSMGGRVALAFAVMNPTLVRKLVLESASPGLVTDEDRRSRREQDQQLANKMKQNGLEWFVEYWGNIPLFESQKKLPSLIRQRIKEQRKQNSIKGLANSLIGMGTGSQPSYWENLKQYAGEVLLLTGSVDKKFVIIAEKMSKRLKYSQWVNIDGCGHAIHVEQPEKFGTIVSGFLSNKSDS
ncbi:2-succinyl-6-hydroxy-2,4-cyclohexadiene-1-carboxylate synthase [Robertmurraya korlensis]|uniref:2-succinyl-6-hydroxy-2, 4-cyclohexadiene-1-carboxylate synthase n=1 Tax=Robertmurraya korlensis TaxID=519977 RepID=UPI00203F5360|nr:2-succinyl-6-hydroxy-2,4-cyclohexadiene-1-carboxylate synthase [Robertmurraya korlensis]MCM3599125.1 2-succinyl-6-hydroxy-2,4-cyclohexadiene-1-carboxylate synthase [Robertmurraya korlensis]